MIRERPALVNVAVGALVGYVMGIMMAPIVDDIAHRHGWQVSLLVAVPPMIIAACVGFVEGWNRND